MYSLVFCGFIIGFIGAWSTIAFMEMTEYRSILGWLRLWIAKRFESQDDKDERLSIFVKKVNASVQSDMMNQDYYSFVAKHSTIVYLITCKYCFGTWLTTALTYLFFRVYFIGSFEDAILLCLIILSSLYFNLYLARPKTIIIKK